LPRRASGRRRSMDRFCAGESRVRLYDGLGSPTEKTDVEDGRPRSAWPHVNPNGTSISEIDRISFA
jgi:hypothetical protein